MIFYQISQVDIFDGQSSHIDLTGLANLSEHLEYIDKFNYIHSVLCILGPIMLDVLQKNSSNYNTELTNQ